VNVIINQAHCTENEFPIFNNFTKKKREKKRIYKPLHISDIVIFSSPSGIKEFYPYISAGISFAH
jgi:hypothetical protein